MKYCKRHREHKKKYSYSGKTVYTCLSCKRESMSRSRHRSKKAAVDYLGGNCRVCGYNKYLGALEFHHIDPKSKDFTIAARSSVRFESIKAELDKCVLLCSNCHREVHEGLTYYDLPSGELNESNDCKHCGVLTNNKHYCSAKCSSISQRRCIRPSAKTLESELALSSYSSLGRKYGVSDNTIRKWLNN